MTIHHKILFILLVLVGLVSFSLLLSQYYFSQKIALKSVNDTFQIISGTISQTMQKHASDIRDIVTIKSKDKDLLVPITFELNHPALPGFIETLQFDHNLHAIYFAQSNGNYYEVINAYGRSKVYTVFSAPKETYWIVIIIIDNIKQSAFLDENYELIEVKRYSEKYDLSSRPWYEQALKSNTQIATPPYLFAFLKEMGMTYAKKVDKTGTVLAVDYTMSALNSILSMHKLDTVSEIFIVDKDGHKLLSSEYNMERDKRENMQLSTELMHLFSSKKIAEAIHYKEEGKKYLLNFTSLPNKDMFLGIKVDENKLLKTHKDNLLFSFSIALLLLILAIPAILYSVKNIVKPIHALITQNGKIEARKFSDVEHIKSNVLEFEALSNSLVFMSKSIQKHAKEQDDLLNALIKLIAEAIDKKSSYTGKHCERVPRIAHMLLSAANTSTSEAFKDFTFTSKEDLRAFEIGAWLHDCGKVTTPDFVVDKSVKLETIYNRIHEIRTRFEVLWRDAQIAYLQKKINEKTLKEREVQLIKDFEFIASANIGSEFMSDEEKKRVQKIATMQWERHFDDRLGLSHEEYARMNSENREDLPVKEDLLSDKPIHIIARDDFDHDAYVKEGYRLEVPESLYNFGEIYNLCIEKGTLTPEERYKINEHVIMSIKMLEKIPFPEHMHHVVEYAGTHHETLIGTGYPRQLTGAELSLPSRIMAIADIFEALTASDRPYKKSKTLSESIHIMSFMVRDKHIDKDLFELFITSGIYKSYAKEHLKTEQIDEVDIEKYLI